MKIPLSSAVVLACAAASVSAGPLTEARVAHIINEVSVIKPADGAHTATLNEVVKDDMAVKTGIKSRSELLFQDETLTRLGPESLFTFKTGTRDMSLERGTMLLQVPKAIGGAKIRTAAVTAAITGTTIMLEHRPGKMLKVLVLEGSLRLSVNGRFGDSLLLLPGKMVIMPPNAKRIPDPVTVDLRKVMKTSSLVKMGDKPLPSTALIESEIATQAQSLGKAELIATNLEIEGRGSEVKAITDDVLAKVDAYHVATASNSAAPGDLGSTPTPASTPTSIAEPTPSATPGATPTPGDDNDPGTIVDYGTEATPLKDVNLDKPIDLSTGGGHGTVNVHATGKIAVKKSIKISSNDPAGGSKNGGNITLVSTKTKDDAIVISDSSQLLSLLNAAAPGKGGVIRFTSSGGKIRLDQATVTAERGTVDIRNEGKAGIIELNKATLNADTIKIQTLGTDGQLNIGGGTLKADTAIDLFASGSNGKVNFNDNTTLSGNSVKRIAGDSVTIKDGKTVTVNGPAPASVFTNTPNYTGSGGNGSTTGRFGGTGATTQPLAALLTGGH